MCIMIDRKNRYWIGVLHSHLPFVKHPDFDDFLEERWLFEAINETYIPLLMVFKKLEDERVSFKLTVSLTPTLMSMFEDEHLMNKYKRHIDKLIELGEKELIRTRTNYDEYKVAEFYLNRFRSIKNFFYGFLNENVLNGYRYFQKKGNLEIITSAATHGFLPFIDNLDFVRLQVDVGRQIYERALGVKARGIWIPECAYFSGLNGVLKDENLRFFFVESHALQNNVAKSRDTYAFKRDEQSAKVVWSSKEGYPGDVNYRDFYRDLGYDMPMYYIKDYLPGGIRTFTGYKYYKITGDTDYKEFYNPYNADLKAKEHAYNFHFNLNKNLENRLKYKDNLVTSFYDAELFGHWWFEGIDFIYYLFKVFDRYKEITPTTPSGYVDRFGSAPEEEPASSSWGDKGYYDVWLNGSNSWIYNHLHHEEKRVADLLNDKTKDKKIIEQMIAELLLAQSSDWAFLMTAKDNKQYATKRQKEHIYNFNRLDKMLENGAKDSEFLNKLKAKNSVFEGINLYETLDRLRRNIF